MMAAARTWLTAVAAVTLLLSLGSMIVAHRARRGKTGSGG